MVGWGLGTGTYDVEAVNVGFVDPSLHVVCDLLWCAD